MTDAICPFIMFNSYIIIDLSLIILARSLSTETLSLVVKVMDVVKQW